ncbi:hypothetical protein ENTCAN_08461 [Enterobacter cancerogenus ATCC 35316]|nr:hypothetical protein ENTCAN_08461 [Enterobacter cancerogenus ATCC 35316]
MFALQGKRPCLRFPALSSPCHILCVIYSLLHWELVDKITV